ncbi:carboxylate-amine ligase [Rubricella aquisinus]|uniref:Putative glutamate--cysteine ligase 2 n=1 Tax=Rubricella aquisinus TaxID=2028108 RepID=A0A840X1X1_9RHOB|nr:carboxylate-amine ligase [Rubricella aquisinus]MBB5514667.1 carboxylate-amine ligase [Rubricella aquisinus]
MDRPAFTLGIEEEYLIVDRETLDLVREPEQAFVDDCTKRLGDQVTGEFLQCQVEVGTKPHGRVADAVDELIGLRAGVAEVAERYGYAPIAASTHPFARWRDQQRTQKDRYADLRDAIGQPVQRMLACGMHIHAGIEDDDMRIDLMNQVAYFLPHLLSLSCSSPFWEGEDTGLASYRLAVFDAMPRTGTPDFMESHAAYRRLVDSLVSAGCIEDATKIWWDIRPSDKFPTLEQRITDICSNVRDTAAIAALYQCLLAYLYRLRSRNQRWRVYPATLIGENRWRGQRYGATGQLLDLGRGTLTPFSALVEELIELVSDEAEMLGCVPELLHLREIARRGTSADRQRRVHKEQIDAGAGKDAAMAAVVADLVAQYTES